MGDSNRGAWIIAGAIVLASLSVCGSSGEPELVAQAKTKLCKTLETFFSTNWSQDPEALSAMRADYEEAAGLYGEGGDSEYEAIAKELADSLGVLRDSIAAETDTSDLEEMHEQTENSMAATSAHVDEIREIPEDYCRGIADLPERGR